MNCSTPGLPDHHQLLEFTQTHVHQVGDAISHIQLFATTWTVAHQALLSMGLPRQEYWIGLPFPSLGDLPDPGIEPASCAGQADSLPLSHLGGPRERQYAFAKIKY